MMDASEVKDLSKDFADWTVVQSKTGKKKCGLVALIDHDTVDGINDLLDFNSLKMELVNAFRLKIGDNQPYLLNGIFGFGTRKPSDVVMEALDDNGFVFTPYTRRNFLCTACRPRALRESKKESLELTMIVEIGRRVVRQPMPCMVVTNDPFFVKLIHELLVKRPGLKICTGIPKSLSGINMFKRLKKAEDEELFAIQATCLDADESRPTRRLDDFVFFDSDGMPQAVEKLQLNDMFVSGFILPSRLCSDKKKKGNFCYSFGRIENWRISGYEDGSPVIWISTELADYYCYNPAASYKAFFDYFFAKACASVTVYKNLCTSSGGDPPDSSLDELLAAVVKSMRGIKMFSSDEKIKGFIISQGKFIHNQLAGLDVKHGTSYAETSVVLALRDKSLEMGKALQMEGAPSSGVRSGGCGITAYWDFENKGVWVDCYDLSQLKPKIEAALRKYKGYFYLKDLFAIGPRTGHKAKWLAKYPRSGIKLRPIPEENIRCDGQCGTIAVHGYSSKEQLIRKPVYTGPAVRNGLYRAKKAILCADVVDKFIMKAMILDAVEGQDKMLLISGDSDFVTFIDMLKQKGIGIMVAAAQDSSNAMFGRALKTWIWEQMI